MENNRFKERTEAEMKLLGVTAAEVGAMLGKNKVRVSEAMNGEESPAAAYLRSAIREKLTGLKDEKRHALEDEIEAARAAQCPHLEGRLSVIMPEDLIYIVTEDGIPVGVWNTVTKKYSELDPVVMPIVGRRAKK